MVSKEHRTGLYVTIPIYFMFLLLATYWARKRMETMKHEGVADALSAHYLGGRSFGPFLTMGTIFASFFSGYTVVGVPNEAFRTGWMSLRWIPASCAVLITLVGTLTRLRKASLIRNHQSPTDFVTDRYQSQLLRYSILFTQVGSSLVYVVAQVVALKSTFNGMFGIHPDNPTGVCVMMLIILLMEWTGGLSTVALTDAVQGVVMVISFIFLPFVIVRNFGGWSNLDPETYPRPDFYQTPSKNQQYDFAQFSVVVASAFAAPHILTRVYAARDLRSLRYGMGFMTLGPWLTMLPGVFLGTVGVQMLAGQETPSSPFSAILEKVMDVGGFPKAVAVIAFTASLAAIMSTADSVIIAVSQLVTTEIIYPMKPDITPSKIAHLGRFASAVTVGLALTVGLLWDGGVSDLVSIQFPIMMMALPTFLWGLYSNSKFDIHPWCQSIGIIVSSSYVILVYFLYIKDNKDAAPINPGVTGLVINLFVTMGLEFGRRWVNEFGTKQVSQDKNRLLFPGRPAWDVPQLARFGEHTLTPELLNRAMTGVKEPFRNIWYLILVAFSVFIVTPLVPENDPPLESGIVPSDINGLPWWAFKILLLAVLPYLFVLGNVLQIPDDYPVDEGSIAKHGIDPDLIELTPREAGRRESYDGPNEPVLRRRQTIKNQMQELGLVQEEEEVVEEERSLTEGQRRLSTLVLGGSIREADDAEAPEAAIGVVTKKGDHCTSRCS